MKKSICCGWGDDVGMQKGMMMAPEMWRRYLKPRMAKLIASFKRKNPDIIVAYHSCGYIIPIIEDLIDIGLDVLNPIQPLAMDPAEIKNKFGDRLSFWGGICVQETLPHGSPEDIRREVALRMDTIGKDGGYMISPAHNVQADTSLENLLAFYKAAFELGNY
jgi:uroporphyrinogen decarboxylase